MSNVAQINPEIFKTVNAKTVKKVGEEQLAVWTPASGKKFSLRGFIVGSSVEAVVLLEDGSTAVFAVLVPAKTTLQFSFPGLGYTSVKADNKLNLTVSAEAAVTGTFYGGEE